MKPNEKTEMLVHLLELFQLDISMGPWTVPNISLLMSGCLTGNRGRSYSARKMEIYIVEMTVKAGKTVAHDQSISIICSSDLWDISTVPSYHQSQSES